MLRCCWLHHLTFHQRKRQSSMEEGMTNCDKEHTLRMTTSVPPENEKCSACTRTFSESRETSYYTCTDCDVMIHRKCAELPKQIDHPHHPQHPLILLAKPPYKSKTCECQVCQQGSWKNSVYHCSSCEFDIDVLCVILEDEDIMIPTHHHPVRLIRRPASFKCNACGDKYVEHESYTCTKPSCGFWIHKECGLSPGMFKRRDHDHPLLLAIGMPVQYRKYKFTCEHCHWHFGSNFWVYYCQRCKYFVHINCITLEATDVVKAYDNKQQSLVSASQPPSLARIRQLKTILKQHHSDTLQEEGPQLPEVKVGSHNHSLVLICNNLQDEDVMIICDGCIEPIDHATCPYYKCGQSCNFFLHTTCTTLPENREVVVLVDERSPPLKKKVDERSNHIYSQHLVHLKGYLRFPKNKWEVVKCSACHSFCNGYTYSLRYEHRDYHFDIKCCYLNTVITHVGHKHDLFTKDFLYGEFFTCRGCGEYPIAFHFGCEPCSFYIGYECATLPATVKHRWDKHPLTLSFPPHFRDTDEGEEFYCEVCEEEIHPKRWMYRCVECDQSFHPRCIPTLGESRNIKFGKTLSIRSHPHRLTLVPQAKLTSQCHTCRKSLQWSRCYECAQCEFYLCTDCLPKGEVSTD